MRKVIILIFLLVTSSISYASELSDQIEERIKAKDWKGVHSILNKFKPKSAEEREYYGELTTATKAVTRYFRDYDAFIKKEGKSAYSYDKTLENGYNRIPKKLPFSKTLIAEIIAKKKGVRERFAQIDEDIKKQEAEAAAAREEVKLRREEAEKMQSQRARETMEEQQKQEEARAHVQAAQAEAKKSPEYLKMDITCNICSAIEDKRSVERALDSDMRYAKKYGVVNPNRRDNAVQRIKADDRTVLEEKAVYKDLFNKTFNTAECKKIKCDDCEQLLSDLSAKLTDKLLDGKKQATAK